jgi:hypothetical protein
VSGNGSAIVAFTCRSLSTLRQRVVECLCEDQGARRSQCLTSEPNFRGPNSCAGPTRAGEVSTLDFARGEVFNPPTEETQ